jgi:CHAT domain-containing protein
LLLIPLEDSRPGGAQAAYDHAWRLFQSGYLAMSQQEAESGFKQYQASDPALAARYQLLQADSMLFRGMYEDALHVLSAYPDSATPDNGSVEKIAIEAVALTRQQQERAADQRIAQAETICGAADFPSCGDVLAARAILEAKIGHLTQARDSFLRALTFAREHRDQWLQVSSYVNLGYMALQVDHFDEAVDWSRSAYQTASALGFQNLAQNAAGNLGWAYFELGDDERALGQFLAAEKAAARLGNVRNELKWLSTAGYVYRDSLDWSRAAQSYRQALDLAEQIHSREDIVITLEDLAQISELSGKLDDASAYIDQVVPMERMSGIHLSANLLLTQGMLAVDRHEYVEAENFFQSIRNDPASLMTIRLAAGYELAKLLESQNKLAAAELAYKATLSTYETARTQLKSEESQLPFGANAAQIYDRYIGLLLREGRTDDALETADQSRARTLEQNPDAPGASKFVHLTALNPRRIAQSTHSTLLFYWLSEKQSHLWVITPKRIALSPLPAQHEIAARVERYRQVLLDVRDPIESGNSDGQQLYQMLVAPAAKFIRPTIPVIILADGILSQLNFETLLASGSDSSAGSEQTANHPANLHYLLDDLTLSSAPSLELLAESNRPAERSERMLLLGNPVSPNQDFPTLPMFSFEMARVESHFAAAHIAVITGEQATPTAYLASQPRQYSYIHFVSHAVASRTNPLDSAIILSNPTTGENSYKLYARDIIQHPIGARLVTISACYGTGTRAYAGEGLVGLTWAFLRAGAQRVIGALWEVSDDSTPILMDSLYQGLAKGDSPADALRIAKLTLLHSHSRFRLPYYWAPFQIYGRR